MSNIINISGASAILHGIRLSMKDGVPVETLKSDLIKKIGIGDQFTSKALRILSGRLPFTVSSAGIDDIRGRIRDVIELKKRNVADPGIVWNFVVETHFVRENLVNLFRSLSIESLITLHNYTFEAIQDGKDLGNNYEKYRDFFLSLESQIGHKEVPQGFVILDTGVSKSFSGTGIRTNNIDTINATKINQMILRKS